MSIQVEGETLQFAVQSLWVFVNNKHYTLGFQKPASLSQAWLVSQRRLLLCRWYCHAWLVDPLLDSHELYLQELYSSQVRIKLFLVFILLTIWDFIDYLKGKPNNPNNASENGSEQWFQRCLVPTRRSSSSQPAKRGVAGEVVNLLPPRRVPSPELVNLAAFAATASKNKVLQQCLHTLGVFVPPQACTFLYIIVGFLSAIKSRFLCHSLRQLKHLFRFYQTHFCWPTVLFFSQSFSFSCLRSTLCV